MLLPLPHIIYRTRQPAPGPLQADEGREAPPARDREREGEARDRGAQDEHVRVAVGEHLHVGERVERDGRAGELATRVVDDAPLDVNSSE